MNNEIAIIKFAGGIKLSENHFKGEKKIKYSTTLVIWSKGEENIATLSNQGTTLKEKIQIAK